MVCVKSVVLQVLFLCSIGHVASDAKHDSVEQEGLPEGQTDMMLKVNARQDCYTPGEAGSLKCGLTLRVSVGGDKSRSITLTYNVLYATHKYSISSSKTYLKDKGQIKEPLVTQGQRSDIDFLRVRIEELESRLDQQDAYNHRVDKHMNHVDLNFDQVKSSINQLATRNLSHTPRISLPVSFSSYLIIEQYPYQPPSDTIVFNHVLLNEENGYDKTTGIFTAPISGVYVFSYFVIENAYGLLTASLTLDDIVVSTVLADAKNSQSSTTGGNVAVVLVSKGQRVQVKWLWEINYLVSWESAGYSTFSGFLLHVV